MKALKTSKFSKTVNICKKDPKIFWPAQSYFFRKVLGQSEVSLYIIFPSPYGMACFKILAGNFRYDFNGVRLCKGYWRYVKSVKVKTCLAFGFGLFTAIKKAAFDPKQSKDLNIVLRLFFLWSFSYTVKIVPIFFIQK